MLVLIGFVQTTAVDGFEDNFFEWEKETDCEETVIGVVISFEITIFKPFEISNHVLVHKVLIFLLIFQPPDHQRALILE